MENQRSCRLKNVLGTSLKIIKTHEWLLDSFVLDYFVEEHWAKLPLTWREVLNNIDPPELCGLLSSNSSQCHSVVWPLSLLALQAAGRCLEIPRKESHSSLQWPVCGCKSCESYSVSTMKLEQCGISDVASAGHHQSSHCVQDEFSNLCKGVNNFIGDFQEAQNDENSVASGLSSGLMSSGYPSSKIMHVFDKHVKPKKRHEIFKMAQVAACTAGAQGCHYVVDVGSGIGHLARMLAYGFGLKVCCFEAQDILTTQARKLDKEFEVTLSKHISVEELSQYFRPVHLNIALHADVDSVDFVQALSTAFGDVSPTDLKFGIVGLHPCGDLGPMLLRLFQHCPGAVFINIVGCCYMKISRGQLSTFQGYPMSEFVSRECHILSYEACELACHAVEAYSERLASGNYSDLMIHCYRAALERIIVKHWPHLRHSGVRSIKHNSQMTFAQYCTAATERLKIDIPVEDLNSEETIENLEQWKRVVTFYTLRLLLAPLVESVILLDRLLCLRESGIRCTVVPVFDPRVSPRNHILIATKKQ